MISAGANKPKPRPKIRIEVFKKSTFNIQTPNAVFQLDRLRKNSTFEDPDRIKIEVVYSPGYCSADHWTNKLEDDFNPYL